MRPAGGRGASRTRYPSFFLMVNGLHRNIGMDHLDELETISIHILREAYANFKSLGMLWSMGKDSTVLLWLTRKAFFGHVPFPLIHIDTHFKIPEMIDYRDQLTREWRLPMVIGYNSE